MLTNKPWVVLDIDDAITQFSDHYYKIFNDLLNTNYLVEDNEDYSIPVPFGGVGDHSEFYRVSHDHRVYETVPIIPGMVEALDALSDVYSIHFITARGKVHNGALITANWLEENRLTNYRLTLCKPGDSKQAFASLNTRLVVEDNAAHLAGFSFVDPKNRLLVSRPWNYKATGDYQRVLPLDIPGTLIEFSNKPLL